MTHAEQDQKVAWLGVGALLAGIGVGLGAFGAHGLRSLISSDLLQAYETGVRYHLVHSLAVIVAALAMQTFPSRAKQFRRASWLFAVGILLFSGSLYLLALTGAGQIGIVTPFGGIAFLLGWTFFALGAFRQN
jgi:uncharacterized membrane protein YgdD (TMEM256/DUF423 family)